MFGKDDLGRLSFGWGGIEEEGVGLYIYIYMGGRANEGFTG